MKKRFEIMFSVSGAVTQVVETDTDMTAEQLEALLNNGILMTTIQEGGDLEFISEAKVIGKVIEVDNNCEYFDYTVERLSE